MKPYVVSLVKDPLLKKVVEFQCSKENRWKFISAEDFSQFNKFLINYDVVLVVIESIYMTKMLST